MSEHPLCPGRIHVNLRAKEILHAVPHNHLGDQNKCDRHVFRRTLKTEVLANPSISIPRVFQKQLRKAHTEG
ncbi:hypothetical protein RvY_17950 [Ramazzottius varieornatus]|uniref:Uncharacterized protein n=1 Tax=Ramazzottius varieornatus TaxID=947166 RepID=A0A1D1W404_RAMVA|nr:hypothetical protein RvY_17950 [Ramazzottius varieornatus]